MMEKKLGTLYLEKRLGTNPPPLILLIKSGVFCILSYEIFYWPLKITKDKNDLHIHVISFFGGLSQITCVQMFWFQTVMS